MQASQLDDNMIPGSTYTFQLKLENLIRLPSTSTIQQDLNNNAPSFVDNNLQVTIADTLSPFSNIYNVQFTYNGDGTDVISDVANSIIVAISNGSSDSFTLVGAVADVAPGGILTGTINDTIDKLTQGVGKGAQNLLTPIEVAIAVVIGLVVLVIFTSGKAGGVSASETGVSVGGHK